MDDQTKALLTAKYRLHMGQKPSEPSQESQQENHSMGKETAKEALKMKYRALLGNNSDENA